MFKLKEVNLGRRRMFKTYVVMLTCIRKMPRQEYMEQHIMVYDAFGSKGIKALCHS